MTATWGGARHLHYLRPAMPAAEPHPRRRRALGRALATVITSGVVLLGIPGSPSAAGQILPPRTTEPSPATTEAQPEETTTTTEAAEPAPTTTEAPTPTPTTPTTRATATTSRSSSDDDVGSRREAVADDDDVADDPDGDDEPVADDEVVDDGAVADDVAEETTSTSRDLLVSGDGSEGAQSTTTTSTTLVEVAAEGDTLDEETRIWLVVAGLVVVAVLIGVWTWRYWVRTKPAVVADEPDPTTVFTSS